MQSGISGGIFVITYETAPLAKTSESGNEDGNEDGNGSGNGSGNEDGNGSGDAENRTKTETILWNIIFPNFRTR